VIPITELAFMSSPPRHFPFQRWGIRVLDLDQCRDRRSSLGSDKANPLNAAQAIRDAAAGVCRKVDGSPVTPADKAAESFIREGLTRLAPGTPII
jgi:hypothetical protein